MAEDRQKRKLLLSLHRPIVTVDRQIVTFRFERFQRVEGFSFLILKNTCPKPPTERAQNAGDGGGISRSGRMPGALVDKSCCFTRTWHFPACSNGTRSSRERMPFSEESELEERAGVKIEF